MIRFLALSILLFTAAVATDQPSASALPPDADKAYKAYLVAMAKVYSVETAKVQKSLTAQEAALRAKDPASADRIKDLMAKIDSAGVFGDLAAARNAGDLMDGTGGIEPLLGAWDYKIANAVYPVGSSRQVFTFRRDGTVLSTCTSAVSTTTHTLKWVLKDNAVIIDESQPEYGTGSYLMTITVKLPVPASGIVQTVYHQKITSATSNSESNIPGMLTRHVEGKP